MVQLILVRPGSTDYDTQGIIQGSLDIPLNDAGRQEAAAAAEKLRAYLPTALYFCEGNPAEDTAMVLGKVLALKPKGLERLTNVNLGLWQGMHVDDVRHKQPKVYKQWQEHPEMVHPPQGEAIADVLERAEESLEKLARKHRSGTIALVAPEPLASLLRHRIEGTEVGDLWHAMNACRIDVMHLQPATTAAANTAKTNGQHKPDLRGTYIYRGSIVERRN